MDINAFHANDRYNIKSKSFFWSEEKNEQTNEFDSPNIWTLDMSSGRNNIKLIKDMCEADSISIAKLLKNKKVNFSFEKMFNNPKFNNDIKCKYNYYII